MIQSITESRYVDSSTEASDLVSRSGAPKLRYTSYGTVIYVPPPNAEAEEIVKIDFGQEEADGKKHVCPRVLLISTWADGKFGFAGRITS